MVQRDKRRFTPYQAAEMQPELRAFHNKVRLWATKTPIGTAAYALIGVLNHDLIVLDGILTAEIHRQEYQRPPGAGGL